MLMRSLSLNDVRRLSLRGLLKVYSPYLSSQSTFIPLESQAVRGYNANNARGNAKRKGLGNAKGVVEIGEEIDDQLKAMMHGRRNQERRDSVTLRILEERWKHLQRLKRFVKRFDAPAEGNEEEHRAAEGDDSVDRVVVVTEKERKDFRKVERDLRKRGYGQKRPLSHVYTRDTQNPTFTKTGAGGHANFMAASSGSDGLGWPVFKHLLPEISFAGHSNSGKSSLVNAITGVKHRHGLAAVSERAGWTDQICFYQLGKKPPVLTLADLPGYGFAVATREQKIAWKAMTKKYFAERQILSCCVVLVDCTRGLCEEDRTLLKQLENRGIKWKVVLTKADLLSCDELAACIITVDQDLQDLFPQESKKKKEKDSTEKNPHHHPQLHPHHQCDTDTLGELQPCFPPTSEEEGEEEEVEEEYIEIEAEISVGNRAASSQGDVHHTDNGDVEGHVDEDGELFHAEITDEEEFDDSDESLLFAVERSLALVPGSSRAEEQHSGARKKFNSSSGSIYSLLRFSPFPVSSSTGAGVQQLWRKLVACARDTSVPLSAGDVELSRQNNGRSPVVREHVRAAVIRRRIAFEDFLKKKGKSLSSLKKKDVSSSKPGKLLLKGK